MESNDPFREYEDEQMEAAKKQMKIEQAKWDALPQEEKDRIIAESEERFARMAEAAEESSEDADEDGEENEEDSEEDDDQSID